MKILVLNYEYPPIGGGGGRAAAVLCQALVERGHQVQVVTSRAVGLPAHEMKEGVHVHRVITGRRSPYQASFLTMLNYVLTGFPKAVGIARSWKPDLLHVHFAVPTGVLGWMLRKLAGVPYLLTVHLGDIPGGVPEKTDRWFRWLYPLTPPIWRNAARVVAVSEFTAGIAQGHYRVPITVIPNAMRLPPESDVRYEPGDPPQLIFAGRFQPQKNLTFLVQALDRLRDMSWTCLLVGDGPERDALREQIEKKGLTDRIHMPGWLEESQVEQKLLQSDILVMPSRSEGLPVVGVQALVRGCAIVANRAGGLVDLVLSGDNGRLCDVGDESCFIEGLRWCLEDRERLQGLKRSSREIGTRFDVNRIVGQYEALFMEILQEQS